MSSELLMPKLGLTMSEGLLLEWKVAPGEAFSKGQLLFVVETDKAATDIEAETDGVFAERLVAEGETVPVGTPVGRLVTADGRKLAASTPARTRPSEDGRPAPQIPAPRTPSGVAEGQRLIATPLARRVARETGIDLATVSGTGPRGRIKLVDVERLASAADSRPSLPESASAVTAQHQRVKPTPIQAAMARRLSQVKHGVPHFYLSTEAEVSALLVLRANLNQDAERSKLTLTHFVLAAVGRALADCPGMNRVWADGEIIEFASTAVSMAVETESGLYVPVVHAAGSVSLDQVAARARTAIDKARSGRLSAAEMEGAAVTVSNAGMHDVTWLTPIINAGQSSILGVGSVREIFRPGPDGAPYLRHEIGLVFSGDHRVHTGVEGLTFLNRIRAYLETPLRLLRAS